MSFNKLRVEELKEIAEFFVVDVEAANEEHGPTKKELLAALASGDEPVTWEDYETIYTPAKEAATPPKPAEAAKPAAKPEPVDTSGYVLVKMERSNPSYQALGYTFTSRHPYHSVPKEVAEHLVQNVDGFRLALESEVADYYN